MFRYCLLTDWKFEFDIGVRNFIITYFIKGKIKSSIILRPGSITTDYTEETISISNYPLSAALTCTKLCDAFEEAWGVF